MKSFCKKAIPAQIRQRILDYYLSEFDGFVREWSFAKRIYEDSMKDTRQERIFIGRMTSDRKLKASREGSE